MANNKYLDQNGLLYVWQKIKSYIASVMPTKQSDLTNDDYTVKDQNYTAYKTKVDTLETKLDEIVTTGGEPNILEGVRVNNADLPIADKKVNILIAQGTNNGTIAVNGTDVAVKGLGSAAYVDTTLFDVAGSAAAVKGLSTDAAGTATVYGALASAAAAQAGVDTINSAGYQTASQVEDKIESYGYQTDEDVATAVSDAITAVTGMGYQTASQVQTKIESYGYQTASDVSTAIAQAMDGVTGVEYVVITGDFPATGEAGTIYLVSNSGTAPNVYDEYIWYNNAFEKIGTTDVDLSGYVKTTDITAITNAEIDTITAN